MSQGEPIFDAEPAGAAAAGQRKPCPMCGEHIAASAKVCRYCGHWLDPSMRPRSSASTTDQLLMPVNVAPSALFAGYLGLFALIPLVGIVTIIVSIYALYVLKQNPDLSGRGRAWFGLIMGVVFTLFWVFCIIMAVTQ